ncbi:hypothetical protein GPJ56_004749 [Histomonas meleagridis]|uniref:uncharacterized protein n=1 Tax=Histomonas meleagridis TaxID=135588 RepID=UPI00355A4BEF|nr:hypothetical protein GPJ56_004749 [Histomonas meleagridis]KAH0803084.1 uncharacterized protein GO595_004177 [Histomonas meleagridis]
MFLLLVASGVSTISVCVDYTGNNSAICPTGATYYRKIEDVSFLISEDLVIYALSADKGSSVFLNFTEINENIKYTVSGLNKVNVSVITNPKMKYLRLRGVTILPNNGTKTDLIAREISILSSISPENNIVNIDCGTFTHDIDIIPYLGDVVAYKYSLSEVTSIPKSYTVKLDNSRKELTTSTYATVQITGANETDLNITPEYINFKLTNEENSVTIIPDGFHIMYYTAEKLNLVIDDSATSKSFYSVCQLTSENTLTSKITINNLMPYSISNNGFILIGSQLSGDYTGDMSHVRIILKSVDTVNHLSNITLNTPGSTLYSVTIQNNNTVTFTNPNPHLYAIQSESDCVVKCTDLSMMTLILNGGHLSLEDLGTTAINYSIQFNGGTARIPILYTGGETFVGIQVFMSLYEDSEPTPTSAITIGHLINNGIFKFGFYEPTETTTSVQSILEYYYALSHSTINYVNYTTPIIVVEDGQFDITKFGPSYDELFSMPGLQKENCVFSLVSNGTNIYLNMPYEPYVVQPRFCHVFDSCFSSMPEASEYRSYLTPLTEKVTFRFTYSMNDGESIYLDDRLANVDIAIDSFLSLEDDGIRAKFTNGEILTKSITIEDVFESEINLSSNKLTKADFSYGHLKPYVSPSNFDEFLVSFDQTSYINFDNCNSDVKLTDMLRYNEVNVTFDENGWRLYGKNTEELSELYPGDGGYMPRINGKVTFTETTDKISRTVSMILASDKVSQMNFNDVRGIRLIGNNWSNYNIQNEAPIVVTGVKGSLSLNTESEILPIQFKDAGYMAAITVTSEFKDLTFPYPMELNNEFYPMFKSDLNLKFNEIKAIGDSKFYGNVSIDKCIVERDSNFYSIESNINELIMYGNTTFDNFNAKVNKISITLASKTDVIPTLKNVDEFNEYNLCGQEFDCNEYLENLANKSDEYVYKCLTVNETYSCLNIVKRTEETTTVITEVTTSEGPTEVTTSEGPTEVTTSEGPTEVTTSEGPTEGPTEVTTTQSMTEAASSDVTEVTSDVTSEVTSVETSNTTSSDSSNKKTVTIVASTVSCAVVVIVAVIVGIVIYLKRKNKVVKGDETSSLQLSMV